MRTMVPKHKLRLCQTQKRQQGQCPKRPEFMEKNQEVSELPVH